jgi:D-alanyl-D-alanine endopeptidase (penicillin-binding protein 7)
MKKIIILLALLASFTCSAKMTSKGQKQTEITAKSWLVSSQGQILGGKNTKEVRSIASITKLMTVMVFLDANKSFTSKTHQELIQRAIISSDNRASRRLCDDYPGGKDDCIFMMNLKAKELGLVNTKFLEPTGLSIFNVSTAEELVKLVEEASKYPEIVKASQTRNGNTNPLVAKNRLTVSKTGFINAAGGCIVLMQDQKVIVILGSKNTRTRIPEADALLKI